jgi:DNA-binding transcriptional regulator GbsR (MarR family)
VTREELEDVRDRFISAWGQMASAWGVSRTMAEVFALLYICGQALNTDEVMDRLRISRGNASMSLRSLVEWGIVARVHRRGDRKEYFQAEQDVWALSRKVIRERLRREILPLLTTLCELRDLTGVGDAAGGRAIAETSRVGERGAEGETAQRPQALTQQELDLHNQRLDGLVELVQTIDKLGERFVGAEGKGLRLAASVLAKIV